MTSHQAIATRYVTALMLAALIVSGGGLVASAQQPPPLSHLTPHLAAEAMSHLTLHASGLPPPALLIPLGNGIDGVLKGVCLADEARLIDALSRADLHQTVLRVGVGRAADARMALIKLQAGDPRSGAFSIAAVHDDAARALGAAFACTLQLDHVDLWAVVPGAEMVGDEQENFPVFSVSATRRGFEQADARAGTPGELIAGMDVVRYSPLFLDYAQDAAQVALSRSALCDLELARIWEMLVEQARGTDVQSRMLGVAEVTAIFNGDRRRREVALTIDDGPHPLVTPLMLKVLEREGVQATFFVVGRKCEEYPGLVRMIARGGHELANHAYSNRRLSALPAEEAWAEVSACDRIVKRVTGQTMSYFRPPGGRCSPQGLRAVGSLGYTVALWSRNTGDWRKPPPHVIRHNALTGLRAGDIILMHQGEMCSVEALPGIIAGVRAAGLEPVTLAQLGRNGGVVRDTPERVSQTVNGGMLGEE